MNTRCVESGKIGVGWGEWGLNYTCETNQGSSNFGIDRTQKLVLFKFHLSSK